MFRPLQVNLHRSGNLLIELHFPSPLPWSSIGLNGQYHIQSIFYEPNCKPIQVRILSTEDPDAVILFPVHSNSKEFAYLFLTLSLHQLHHPELLPAQSFQNLLDHMNSTLECNIYEQEVRIQFLHASVDYYDV